MSTNISGNSFMGTMTVGEIVSRAWRLYRLNIKSVLLYTLIPTVVFTVSQVLLNMPPVFMGDKPDPAIIGLSCCFLYPTGFSLLFIGLLVAIFFNACMIKAFYNRLIGVEFDYKYIFEYSKNNLMRLFKLCGLISVEAFLFMIIDTFLIIFIYILFLFPVILSVGIMKENNYLGGALIVIGVLLLFSGLAIISFVFMLQFFICCLQIVATILEKKPILNCFSKSFEIAGKNIPRVFGFLTCVFSLWYALAMFFNLPASIYMIYTMFSAGITNASQISATTLIIVTVWGNLINLFIWPLIVSSITMYYYDHRVRSEGLDMTLTLKYEMDKKQSQQAA